MNRRIPILVLAACVGLVLAATVHAVGTSAQIGQPTAGSPPITTPAIVNMGALKASETARDRSTAVTEAASIARLSEFVPGVPEDMLPGKARRGTLRVLVTDVGPNNAAIYAYRTEKGRVCGGLTGQSSGCFQGFANEAPVVYTFGSSGPPDDAVIVYGFAPDNVVDASVTIAGESYEATFGRNAFYVRVSNRAVTPRSVEAITVRFANGRSQTIPITLHS